MAEKWLTIVEYARTYNVSDMTVRRRIKTGKLDATLQDGKYFIPMKDESRPAVPQQAPRQVVKAHPAPQRTFAAPAAPQHHDAPQNYRAAPGHQASSPFEGPAPRARHVGAPPPPVTNYADSTYAGFDEDDGEPGLIPASLRRSVTTGDTATVDARALLAFCEASLKKTQESERRQVERFKSKLETLEATVALRDGEVKSLKQQLEDLQLLVKVLERKRQGA